MDVHFRRRTAQPLQVRGRQTGNGEKTRSAVGGRIESAARQVLPVGSDGIDPVPFAIGNDQSIPQASLPVRCLARLPSANPRRTVEQAAVVDLRQPRRQLEALARVAVREVAAQRIVLLPMLQGLEDSPAQARRRETLPGAQFGHRLAHRRPRELGRQLRTQMRRDAQPRCQGQSQPATKHRVRYHDSLRGQRIARLASHFLGQAIGKDFEPVGGMDVKAGSRIGHGIASGLPNAVRVSLGGVQFACHPSATTA